MDSYIFIAILGPFTLAAMISTSAYMKIQAKRLSTEIQRKGLVVYTVPVFVTGRISEESRPPLISPFTGLPPPPPYSRTGPRSTDAPPSYSSDPGSRTPDGRFANPPLYEMVQFQTVNETNQSTQRTN